MNFPPFGSHFATGIPSIHQFAAKFSHEGSNGTSTQTMNDGNHHRYHGASSTQFNQSIGMAAAQPSQISGLNSIKYNNHAVNHNSQYQVYSSQQQDLSCASDSTKNVKREEETGMPSSWQSLATPGSTVADYLSHLPASTLPLSLHHFLKYSAESIKKEADGMCVPNGGMGNQPSSLIPMVKKNKKKKKPKEKKPRPKPGEIRLTTALDGSTLYCCPECHMAYPEKEMLEQHLLGHTLERRFVCDICGAGLKRKDHLTRHKQSHNPERPFVCTVCLKAFKRKEQLTLHFVIHSGDKRHVCTECGKGFYRKDHLRKHTRSHIARRVKAELSQHATPAVAGSSPQSASPLS